ncbi:dystroglycan 1 isoform X1 [Microplitis demolitor]|uniref:dystroglycan 1 isoform X1 n=1 Tax=Microplitis demolitor TaxID=69319 RepID=UPI0004CDC6E6|nr:dystroglycan 1 isoform X1 [Microplitis demolitor]XP_053595811.1 dystroglycan 1 isoform X1 [Microplitis demolitor]
MKLILLSFIIPLALGLTFQEDDLVFDDVSDDSQPISSASPLTNQPSESSSESSQASSHYHKDLKIKGIPNVESPFPQANVTTTVGHIFKFKISKQSFGSSVNHYEIRSSGSNNKALPHWLYYDEATTTLMGVPAKKDVGQHHLSIKAYYTYGDIINSLFTIKVLPEKTDEVKHKDGKTHCRDSEEQTLMTILLDVKFDDLNPVKKVHAIEKLASSLGLHVSAFSMHGRSTKDESASEDSRIILTGPGNVKRRKEKHSTSIQWQVGCDGHLWKHQAELLKQIKKQARDKTLAKTIQLPVLLWRVKTYSNDLIRSRREAGSGDYARHNNRNNNNNNNNDNDDDYDDENYDYDESYDEDRDDRDDPEDNESITTLPPRPISGFESREELHPHRHHHGQETSISIKAEEEIDEHDIIPVIDRKYSESSPSTSAPTTQSTTKPTTIEQTTPLSTTPQEETPTSTTPSTTVSTVTEKTEPEDDDIDTTDINDIINENNINLNNNNKQSTLEIETEITVVPTTFLTTLPTSSSTISASTDEIKATTTTITTTSSTSTSPSPSTTVATVFAVNDTIDEDFEFTENITEYPTVITELNPLTTETLATETTELLTTPTPTTPAPTTPTPTPAPSTTTTTTTWVPPTTTTSTISTTSASSTTSTTTTMTSTTLTTPTLAPTEEIVTTEKVVYRVRNYPPRQDKRLEKIRVTAGKPLNYFIPANTFSDIEDGDTRNLRLSLYLKGSPLKSTHWLQFNEQTQEIYGLPLDEHVSIWDYDLVAADREGLNVSDRLDIYVQQHKLTRSVNHDFSIYLRIDKRSRFPTAVDWQLKIIRGLAQLYGDNNSSSITVRTIQISEDQAVFTWTNDTIPPSSECPKEAINRLYHVLVASNDGDPSSMLQHHLGPEIRVKRVAFHGYGQCEHSFTRISPQVPEISTQEPKVNDPPMPRNQVDHITARVGQLLIYRVPEDTFYDPEDGPTRHLRLSLLHGDRTPIASHEWLQFDVNNQEFYGVPLKTDSKRREYQLIAVDKEGATANDNLVVEVKSADISKASAEFTIKLGVDYDTFIGSAMMKKNFILRLRDLFGDKDTDAISLTTITPVGHKNTMITWRNTTLPVAYCPNSEIQRLSEVLFVKPDNKELTNRIERIMGMEFPVDQLTLTPMGICLGEFTRVHSHDGGLGIDDEDERGGRRGSGARGGMDNDDYLITFVLPAIIIAAMLALAGIIACILYRRKRSGKMSVSEHADERQSFRSKGIPVIFQDELEEKPEPGDKAPVILKEEKPPLPPPEYLRSEDGADQPMLSQENSEEPYQPPPPFARTSDNTRQNRPKPTPTYRKPPPYVPP